MLSLVYGFIPTLHAATIQVHQQGTFDSGSILNLSYKLDQADGRAFDVSGSFTDSLSNIGSFSGFAAAPQAISTVWWTNKFMFDNGGIFGVSAHQTGLYASNSVFGYFAGPDNKWNALDVATATEVASSVPEPSALALIGLGLVGMLGVKFNHNAFKIPHTASV